MNFWVLVLGIPLLVIVMVGEVYLAIKVGVIIGDALARRRIEKEGTDWLKGDLDEDDARRR